MKEEAIQKRLQVEDLRNKLRVAEDELISMQRECVSKSKHMFMLTGFDTKYFYAKCEVCQLRMRYEHGSEEKMAEPTSLFEPITKEQQKQNKLVLDELETYFRSIKDKPVSPKFYITIYDN